MRKLAFLLMLLVAVSMSGSAASASPCTDCYQACDDTYHADMAQATSDYNQCIQDNGAGAHDMCNSTYNLNASGANAENVACGNTCGTSPVCTSLGGGYTPPGYDPWNPWNPYPWGGPTGPKEIGQTCGPYIDCFF